MAILLLASLFSLDANIEDVDNILLTWNCKSYTDEGIRSYQEIFARSGGRMRIERWFVDPGERPDPKARSIFIGYGATGTVYSHCCEKKEVKTEYIEPVQAIMEIGYGCAWWIGLDDAREYNDYEKGALVYASPHHRVFLDGSTKLPKEILYYHLRIVYDSYTYIPGLGSIPGRFRVYDNDRLVLEKSLTTSEDVSDGLFNAENLPFKVGTEKIEVGDLPTMGE